MRLLHVETDRGLRLCADLNGRFVDLLQADPGLPNTIKALVAQGPEGIERARQAAGSASVSYESGSIRVLPPIPDPQKIICLGLNYRDHALETGADIPEEPILFSKYPSAIVGPEDPIILPKVSSEVDYEAELVVVVGVGGKEIKAEHAMNHVAGFTVGHDVSARDWQLRKPGKQWMAGKTFDTFAPIGPVLVTTDEVNDPHNLGIRLRLNGQTMQDSNTAQLIFKIPETIAYLSKIFRLEPGDLIFTGTPPGVGMALKPPVWLKAGDLVEVEIDGLGILRNPVHGS